VHATFSHEIEVESYLDAAEGVMGDLEEGRCWVSEIIRIRLQERSSSIAYFPATRTWRSTPITWSAP
jgi:hypothetical protein